MQDKDIVTMQADYALSNGAISSTVERPITTSNNHIFSFLYRLSYLPNGWISYRDFKLVVTVLDHSKCSPWMPNTRERVVVRSCDLLTFLGTPITSLERLKLG